MKTRKTCKYYDACATSYSCHKCGGYVNAKREACAEAGRELRQLQREHLREVMREMRGAIEGLQAALTDHKLRDIKRYSLLVADAQASKALEKARGLGL